MDLHGSAPRRFATQYVTMSEQIPYRSSRRLRSTKLSLRARHMNLFVRRSANTAHHRCLANLRHSLPHCIWMWTNCILLMAMLQPLARANDESPNWSRSSQFDETSFTKTIDGKIRLYVNAPLDGKGEPGRATRLIVYTLPAGNTIEQTLGCKAKPGLDWHYDIQHVAAQLRLLRSLMPSERIVLVCPEGPGLSWSAFRKAHADADSRMAQLVDHWRTEFGTEDARVMLAGHSNGGSFMFGVIDGAKSIPKYIDRVAFL